MREAVHILGVDRCPPFYRDALFHIALLVGGIFLLLLWLLMMPGGSITLRQVLSWNFLSLTVWQPFCEELLFRGFLQGQLSQLAWGQRSWHSLTVANVIASLLFMLGHWWRHPPLWALTVLVPSLLLGYVRERHASIFPCVALHGCYNAGYFGLTGLP